jgi:hypothetical protein
LTSHTENIFSIWGHDDQIIGEYESRGEWRCEKWDEKKQKRWGIVSFIYNAPPFPKKKGKALNPDDIIPSTLKHNQSFHIRDQFHALNPETWSIVPHQKLISYRQPWNTINCFTSETDLMPLSGPLVPVRPQSYVAAPSNG